MGDDESIAKSHLSTIGNRYSCAACIADSTIHNGDVTIAYAKTHLLVNRMASQINHVGQPRNVCGEIIVVRRNIMEQRHREPVAVHLMFAEPVVFPPLFIVIRIRHLLRIGNLAIGIGDLPEVGTFFNIIVELAVDIDIIVSARDKTCQAIFIRDRRSEHGRRRLYLGRSIFIKAIDRRHCDRAFNIAFIPIHIVNAAPEIK